MNLGLYEIMDRISVIQDIIDGQIYHHKESDDKLKELLDISQENLNQAYQYIGERFNNSCEEGE